MKLASFRTMYLLLSFISLSPKTLATHFHKVMDHMRTAHDKAFHDALLQQLATYRNNESEPSKLLSPVDDDKLAVPNSHLGLNVAVASVAADTNGTFADGSTSSFQLYFDSTLPTSPPPPTDCATALKATISCNSTVPLMSSYPYLLINDLPFVCTTECAASLATYRAGVVSACGNYVITGSSNISYLPTFAVDTIAGPYTVQCLQDPTTHQYCEPLLSSYNTTGGLLSLPDSQLCTFCTLKTLNVTLSNPVTFSEPVAELLSDAVSQCGPNFFSYNVTTPPGSQSPPITSSPPFGVNATTDPAADCAITGHMITISSNISCSAVAAQNSVTVHSILSSNPFLVGSSDCTVPPRSTLCIPQSCTLYTIQNNDTCDGVVDKVGSITGTNITTTQLLSFNPDLGTYCQLMSKKVGQGICITPNGGWPNVGASTPNVPSAPPTTFASIPTPTVSGTTSNCGRYYQVQAGDICNTVVLNNSISLPDFLTLNPEIDANCTNLWLGYYYCVAPYPPLTSSSAAPVITTNYTSATLYEYPLPTTSYTPSLATIIMTDAGIPAPTNVANGTRTVACGYYYNVAPGDTLDSITNTTGRNASTLYTWNPELKTSPPVAGTAICILFPTGNYTLSNAPTPSNVAPNTTTDICAEYYTVASGDNCPSIEAQFDISNSDFLALNPGLNSQCTNLIAGLSYCVLSIYPPPSGGGTPTGPPNNVAPGTITEGCTQYYTVVSGDTCSKIEGQFSLTDAQFRAMNPEIDAGCTNIILGDAYCVETSNGTGPPTGPPSNVAPGTITEGCTEYYTIVSGDTCSKIEGQFSISDSLFRSLNPEIDAGCTNIVLGEAYCVQISNSTTPPTGPPSNVAPGTITDGCTQYYTVVSGDTCSNIEGQFSITDSLFHAMNPEINTGCTNIVLGEAYCVHTGNSTTTPPSGPPSNLASGSLTNCTSYYTVVSGDSCPSIVSSASISFSDFLRWNPEVNSACSNIFAGEAYCIGGGGNAYAKIYTVVSGDSCFAVEQSQGITSSTLTSLNPWLDANCDLSVGQRLCVG